MPCKVALVQVAEHHHHPSQKCMMICHAMGRVCACHRCIKLHVMHAWSVVQEIARTGQDYTATLRRLLSPVFFSTLEDGTVVEGLEGLTSVMQQRERPLL